MVKRLINTPEGGCLLEIETAGQGCRRYPLPSTMSPAARLAFLSSSRLQPVLARLEEAGAEDAQGSVVFALHKLALDMMTRHPSTEPGAALPPASEAPPLPLAHIVIRQCSPSVFMLCINYQDQSVCREEHLDTLQDALVSALLSLPPEAMAVEVTYEGVVSGTYPRMVLESNPDRIAADAVNTKVEIDEVCAKEAHPFGAAWTAARPQGRF